MDSTGGTIDVVRSTKGEERREGEGDEREAQIGARALCASMYVDLAARSFDVSGAKHK